MVNKERCFNESLRVESSKALYWINKLESKIFKKHNSHLRISYALITVEFVQMSHSGNGGTH